MQPLSVCVCVCSGVLIFVQFWDSEEGFHLWVAECRASVDAGSLQDKQSFSVTLACKSRLPFCVFLKLLTRFLLYVQVSWGGESSETFCKYFWKSCGRFFCIWRIRPGAADYTAVDVTFLTVFFSLTIFSCKKFPVSAKKVQLLSPASLLSGKT